jgi:hypothetical protein
LIEPWHNTLVDDAQVTDYSGVNLPNITGLYDDIVNSKINIDPSN